MAPRFRVPDSSAPRDAALGIRPTRSKRLAFCGLLGAGLLFVVAAHVAGQELCTDCHDALSDPSVHTELGCTDCHEGMTEFPHETGELSPSCATCHEDVAEATGLGVHADFFEGECASCHGEAHDVAPVQEFRLTVDDLCGECHDDERATVLASAHQNVSRGMSPVCSDCHGAHGILSANDPDAPTYHLEVAITCSRCHANEELMLAADLEQVAPAYHDSIHGFALEKSGLLVAPSCVTCHGAHDILPHEDPNSRTARPHVAEGCAQCHAGVFRTYQDSIHGQAAPTNDKAPICIDCHSAHSIQTTQTGDWLLDVVQECGTCHEALFDSYRRDFHGQATAIGYRRAAKCSDCHGAHDIQRVSNATSPVAKDQLLETCRGCHPGASENYAQYNPHPDPNNRDDAPVYWTSKFMKFLLGGVFAFFGVHTALWLPRSWQERRRRKRERAARPDHTSDDEPTKEKG